MSGRDGNSHDPTVGRATFKGERTTSGLLSAAPIDLGRRWLSSQWVDKVGDVLLLRSVRVHRSEFSSAYTYFIAQQDFGRIPFPASVATC